MLKWEIIKKYYNKGIRKFDLGVVPSNDNSQKYYGIYQSKIGFNPKIYEYCDDFDLIINKHLYNLLKKFPNIQKKSR